MPITATDIQYRLSTTAGAAGDTTAGTPAGSLGKYASTTQVGTAINDLFDDVSGDENAASDVEYRCIFVYNAHATLTWLGVVVWLSAETAGGANIAIAVDGIAASDIDAAPAQADQVANENTAPSGETFSSPTTKGAGLSIGDLTPDQVRAIWVRRTATNSAALNNDGATIRAEGDTGP
jgi:hypothetical protein